MSIVFTITHKNLSSGCKSKLKTPLLHFHEQTGLLDKIKLYFEEARGTLISQLNKVFVEFTKKIPEKYSKEDRDLYISNGRSFLFVMTPEGIYYGRYLTESSDEFIHSKNAPTTNTQPSKSLFDCFNDAMNTDQPGY